MRLPVRSIQSFIRTASIALFSWALMSLTLPISSALFVTPAWAQVGSISTEFRAALEPYGSFHRAAFDFALARLSVLRLLHALRESNSLLNPSAQFVDRLLVIFVPGWRLSGEPGRSRLDIVASALDLISERLHIRREAASHEHASVELLGGRIPVSLAETSL
jgi:hypothetical protein